MRVNFILKAIINWRRLRHFISINKFLEPCGVIFQPIDMIWRMSSAAHLFSCCSIWFKCNRPGRWTCLLLWCKEVVFQSSETNDKLLHCLRNHSDTNLFLAFFFHQRHLAWVWRVPVGGLARRGSWLGCGLGRPVGCSSALGMWLRLQPPGFVGTFPPLTTWALN